MSKIILWSVIMGIYMIAVVLNDQSALIRGFLALYIGMLAFCIGVEAAPLLG